MRTSRQVVFITAAVIDKNVKVFDSRSDAMRETGGDPNQIIPRTVIRDSEKGPYRKPPKKRPAARRSP